MRNNGLPLAIPAPKDPAQRVITGWFMSRHAVTPGDAIAYKPADAAGEQQFAAMLANGTVKRAGAGYWFDMVAYVADHRRQQARKGAIFAVFAVIAALVLVFFYRG